jgi:hypothetical protein
VKSNDVNCPSYHSCCWRWSLHYHQSNRNATDFVIYTNRKNINIKDNFDLVLKLLLSSCLVLKYLKQVNQKIKLAEDNLEKIDRTRNYKRCFKLRNAWYLWLHWREWYFIAPNQEYKIPKNILILIWRCRNWMSSAANIYSDILNNMDLVISNNMRFNLRFHPDDSNLDWFINVPCFREQ